MKELWILPTAEVWQRAFPKRRIRGCEQQEKRKDSHNVGGKRAWCRNSIGSIEFLERLRRRPDDGRADVMSVTFLLMTFCLLLINTFSEGQARARGKQLTKWTAPMPSTTYLDFATLSRESRRKQR
jgi:hypothetical protein